MAPPTPESLTGMGLLGKKDSIITETLFLRDDTKRKAYYDKFYATYGGMDEFRQVKWGVDSAPTSCGIRCNANIVLLQIGARIPASEDGARAEKEIRPIIQYPLKAMGEWGIDYLTCSHSLYKGMERVLISEPSKMIVPRYYKYYPK